MRKHSNDRLQGTLDMLVLKALASQGRMHGYAITLRIEQISASVLRLEEGSLYPALHRMTQSGWLQAEWGASENNRRARYYSITPSGRKQLAEEEQNWAQLTEAVTRVQPRCWCRGCEPQWGWLVGVNAPAIRCGGSAVGTLEVPEGDRTVERRSDTRS